MPEIVVGLDDLKVTWKLKNQSDLSKRGGRYRISALEPISSCSRVFKLEIINFMSDDEGVYSCHQTCKDSGEDVCKSSAKFELKVYSPPPTTGKRRPSAYRNWKRHNNEFNFVLSLKMAGSTSRNIALKNYSLPYIDFRGFYLN